MRADGAMLSLVPSSSSSSSCVLLLLLSAVSGAPSGSDGSDGSGGSGYHDGVGDPINPDEIREARKVSDQPVPEGDGDPTLNLNVVNKGGSS